MKSHVLMTSHPLLRNGIVKGDYGGVGFLVSRDLYVKGDDGSLSSLVALSPQLAQTYLIINVLGRAISLEIVDCRGRKIIHTVHNCELSTRGMTSLECSVERDIACARGDRANSSVFLGGDFNFQLAGEAKIQMECPFKKLGPAFAGRWSSMIDISTEIRVRQPNHFFLRLLVLIS